LTTGGNRDIAWDLTDGVSELGFGREIVELGGDISCSVEWNQPLPAANAPRSD
jgi:hypothetical protein